MKQLAQGTLGTVGTYDVKLEDGKIKIAVELDVAGAGIDELEKAIPGGIDNAILEVVRPLLKSL